MKISSNLCVVYCNTDSEENAKLISDHLVQNKIAACVSIFTNVLSVFEWNDKMHHRKEFTMMIKTHKENLNKLESTILDLHPDTVPEIISVAIQDVHEPYQDWILSTIKRE